MPRAAQRFHGAGALIAADGGVDRVAHRAGQLYGRGADAAGAAMDQQRLALGQTAAVEHVAPDGEVGFGQAGGFDVGKATRNRQALGGGRDAVFGIAAARNQRADLVTDRQAAGSRVAGHDFAGHFQAGQVRRARGG